MSQAKPILKPYDQLKTYERNHPCLEYPGRWVSYVNGNDEEEHESFEDALKRARERWENYQGTSEGTVQIAWMCSENDPRIGQVWFTGFYIHGKFDQFGNYQIT